MLEATSSAQEQILGIDFAEHYRNSELYRSVHVKQIVFLIYNTFIYIKLVA